MTQSTAEQFKEFKRWQEEQSSTKTPASANSYGGKTWVKDTTPAIVKRDREAEPEIVKGPMNITIPATTIKNEYTFELPALPSDPAYLRIIGSAVEAVKWMVIGSFATVMLGRVLGGF